MLHRKRIERLREMMKEKYIFGVYVTSPENVFYLSGFTGFGDARLLIGRTNAWLITDSRYTVQAAEECPEYTLVTANAENIATLEELLRKEMICTLGFENERIAYRDYKALKERYDFVQLAELDGYFTELRDVKEEDELFCIEKACQIACRSLYEVLDDIRPGTAESEIAAELDMPVEKVQEVQKYGREPISLHTPLGEDGDSEFGDLIEDTDAIAPSDAVAFSLLQEQFRQVLETLSPREAGVIKMRYGLEDGQPKTLDDIGRVYGVTRERIRQIESKTMSKLRHPSRSQTLRDFLDQ